MTVITGAGASPLTAFMACIYDQQEALRSADERRGADWLTVGEVVRDIEENGQHEILFQAAYHADKAPLAQLSGALDAHKALLRTAWSYSQGDATQLQFGLAHSDAQQTISNLRPYLTPPARPPRKGEAKPSKSGKPNASPGSAPPKIIAALTAHHKYDNRSCQNMNPIGTKELAAKADVSDGSVTGFWKRTFKHGDSAGSFERYKAACASGKIALTLGLLNGDITSDEVLSALEDDIHRRQSND